MKLFTGFGTAQSRPDSSIKSLTVHPLLICSGLYSAGVFSLFDRTGLLGLTTASFTQSAVFLTLCASSLFMGLVLTIVSKRRPIPSMVGTANVAVICVFIGCILLALSSLFPQYSALPIGCSACFLGTSLPLCLLSWASAFQTLTARNILLNSSLAFGVFAFAVWIETQLTPSFVIIVCIAFLLTGSLPLTFLSRKGFYDCTTLHEECSKEVNPSLPQLIASIPLMGMAISTLTVGATYHNTPVSVSTSTFLPCVIVGSLGALFTLTTMSTWQERRLSFWLYRLGLPSMAMLALLIKMIPIELIANELFREYMYVFFHLLIFMSWTYVISLLRSSSRSPLFICGVFQIAISAPALIGFGISLLKYPWNKSVLGAITAFFLLYAVISLGRNIILYAKGTETNSELSGRSHDIESTCEVIAARYGLSPRESEVLVELAYGHASSYVAKVLYISNNTARTHMKNIYKKLGINSRETLLELIRREQAT